VLLHVSLWLAVAWYFASSLMPSHERPSIFAASREEPDPLNGSSTRAEGCRESIHEG